MIGGISKRRNLSGLLVVAMIAALAVVVSLTLNSGEAKAAFGDRNPAGSVVMPADKVLEVAEGADTKINFGKTYDYSNYYYFKIKAKKTGYIVFKNDYTHGYSVVLCNAKKKVISKGESYSDDFYSAGSQYKWQDVLHYGVKKGTVYHIRVKGASTERFDYNSPYIGSMKWTNKAVKAAKFGKSKKKAKKIKRNKKIKGLFVAGNKKAQWYKVKANKKKTNFYFEAKNSNGAIAVEVHYKSYGKWWKNSMNAWRSDENSRFGYLKSNKKKNTYYVKVYPKGKTSGTYTLRWK